MYIKDEKKYLKINASEVSACIGDNKYISRDVILLKIWKRLCNETFEEAINRNNIKIINIKNNNNINKKYKQNYKRTTSNRENGLNNEKVIIDLYQSMEKVSVKDNNKKRYTLFINKNYDKLLYHIPFISGFIDGIVNNEYIVEMKDRQNKVFDDIPNYEMVQMIVYMKITNIHECHHIERYKDEIKTTIIKFDKEKWNIIEKKIIDFVDYFEKIYFNDVFQNLFLRKILQNIKINNELSSNMGFILEFDKK
jgi:hypothetical protein